MSDLLNKENILPQSFEIEKENISKYFNITSWQGIVIIGIAISGIASFVNTYNAWSGINIELEKCSQTSELKKKLYIQFIVIMVLSSLAIVLGIVLAWLFRTSENPRKILTFGIITLGILGIVYALATKFQNTSNSIKLTISWASFIGFIILGFFVSKNQNSIEINEDEYE